MTRRSLAQVRNPVLALPAVAQLQALPASAKGALERVLLDLRVDAALRAESAWRRRKAPMAAYWRAVSVYAGHVARALR